MKKRWKIFWIVCGSMFLIGIICCSVSWGMGTTLTDIAHQFPHGISWVSEDKTYGDPDDDDDIDDDQEEDNETDTDDDQDEQKQEETAQAQEKANMKDATGVIEGNGKATYQNIHEIKSTVTAMALPALCTGFCVLSDGGETGTVLSVGTQLWPFSEAAGGLSGRESL